MQTHNSPIKAIREKCLECSCGQAYEVKMCPITDCPLYRFRYGKKPIKQNLSDEAREKSRQRALKNLSRRFVDKIDLESNDKEIGGNADGINR